MRHYLAAPFVVLGIVFLAIGNWIAGGDLSHDINDYRYQPNGDNDGLSPRMREARERMKMVAGG